MGQFRTDFLYSTPNVVTSVGSLFGIAGNYYSFNSSSTPEEADMRALKEDWGVVSQDLLNSFISVYRDKVAPKLKD
ncbi:MAG: hypothetical protein K1X66_07850 [Verrucomicrobiae bacterium]|nr:hypothetical protein [Verrucomicrobiae bacterium]